MEASLKRPSENDTPADQNLVDQEPTNLPSVRGNMSLGAVTGETSQSDIRIPYLQIAYGVGKLATKFNPGDFVLGGEHLLVSRGKPLTVIILAAVKYYKEKLSKSDLDAGLRPRSFATEAEVLKNKGTLEYKNAPDGSRIHPTFGPAMDLKLLIQQPEGLTQGPFGLEIDGAFYTPAYFSVDKAGYTRVGKEIQTQQSLALSKVGLLAGLWELHTEIQLINGNNTVVPMIKLMGRTTEAARAEITKLFAPASA